MFRLSKILLQAESISSILWRLSGIEAMDFSHSFSPKNQEKSCCQAQLDAEKQPQMQATLFFFVSIKDYLLNKPLCGIVPSMAGGEINSHQPLAISDTSPSSS